MTTLLDFTALIVGLIYIFLEYRAHILVWLAGIIMPAIDLWLYWDRGLYGDFGLALYYLLAGLYGFLAWRYWDNRHLSPTGRKETTDNRQQTKDDGQRTADDRQQKAPRPITRFPLTLVSVVRCLLAFLAIWAAVWAFLNYWTDSTVPITDSLTNALSIIGLWMLSRKYVEQWFVWIVADAIYVWLYAYKGLPFKATLYSLYIIIAFFGIRKWLRLMREQSH